MRRAAILTRQLKSCLDDSMSKMESDIKVALYDLSRKVAALPGGAGQQFSEGLDNFTDQIPIVWKNLGGKVGQLEIALMTN